MWYKATTASVSNGSTIVQILSGDDISIVQEEGGLIFEGESPVQIKRGYSDGSGNNFIELQQEWPYNDKSSQPLVAFPTDASFAEATIELRRVIDTLSVASTTEAQQGEDDEKIMTPLKVKQAIDSNTSSLVPSSSIASTTEAESGNDDTKVMTPLKTKQSIDFNTGTAAAADVTTSLTDSTKGRLLKVGDFGISGIDFPPFSNTLNYDSEEVYTGNHRIIPASLITLPVGVSSFGTLEVSRYGSADINQTYKPITQNRIIFRRLQGDVVNDWIEMYHSGNTNFNEFGGLAVNNVVAHGVALNSNFLVFYLPLSSYEAPTSITVEGTFKITRPVNNGTPLASGLVPTLFGISSNKIAVVGFNSLNIPELKLNDSIELISESAASKITVNF